MYRENGTRFAPAHTKTISRSGRKSVPVWAWISFDGAGMLHRINGRLTGKHYKKNLGRRFTNICMGKVWDRRTDPVCSRAVFHPHQWYSHGLVRRWRCVLSTSSMAPQRSRHEPYRECLGWNGAWLDCQRGTAIDLWDSVLDIWNHLSLRPNYWRTLINSMPQRLRMVIEAEGVNRVLKIPPLEVGL